MFLTEKYAPAQISELSFNQDIMTQLQHLATYDNIPHIILTGPEGSGKKMLVRFFLKQIYDDGVDNIRKNKYVINGPSKNGGLPKSNGSKKEIEICESRYHIVIETTNTNHEKYILQEIIKQYASYKPMKVFKANRNFKTIVIHNVDRLTSNSQAALRRTMEKYASNCRFIMICDNLSKILDPLCSRCTIFRVPKPSLDVIMGQVSRIALMENLDLDRDDLKQIRESCDNSLERAIYRLDCKRLGCDGDLPIDKSFHTIINLIMEYKHDFVTIYNSEVRQLVYNILITDIPDSTIITRIVNLLIDRIDDDEICSKIIQAAAKAEANSVHGRRDSMHIDWVIWEIVKALEKIV